MSVWVQLYYEGNAEPEGHAIEIEPIPKNAGALAKATKENYFKEGLERCLLSRIEVYMPGTQIPIPNGTAPLKPGKTLQFVGLNTDNDNPLIVVAPVPDSKRRYLADGGPPPKRKKLREAVQDTKVQKHKCIDLMVNKVRILTPAAVDNVRYYGREGMEELFGQLVDLREQEENFNIEFIGAPGTGKSNLAWAVAGHLGKMQGMDVIWAGRRSRADTWAVFQFKEGSIYGFGNLPRYLSDVLKLAEFKDSNVLIVDTPISLSDETQTYDGAAAYRWASDTTYHDSRIGLRRVIHVSSLGAATQKEVERIQINVEEKIMRPWTRQDFIKALEDPQLKQHVCETLNITDPSSVTAEDLVDSKFYYSGINARWFYNHKIEMIKEECDKIIKRITSTTIITGDRHREALNSALQRYQTGGRQVVLFTSSYLANAIGRNTDARKTFLEYFPLIEEYLGNGAPGEIFETDFAVHLHHCHDLAAAQRAVVGEKAQGIDVPIGATRERTRVLWPTGKLFKLPPATSDGLANQSLPKDAIQDKDTALGVAQWFVPEDNKQQFFDFFVLIPEEESKWQLRCIQNTVGKTHSPDLDQLKRVVGGVLDSGYILCKKIVVAYIVEDLAKQGNVGLKQSTTITLSKMAGTRSNSGNQSHLLFTVEPLHVSDARTGGVPS